MKRFEKLDRCPRCIPDARGAYFDRELTEDDRWLWVCRNCGWESKPRVLRKRATEPGAFALGVIAALPAAVQEERCYPDDEPRVEVKRDEAFTSVVVRVGRGLCEESWQIFVGHCGGVRAGHVGGLGLPTTKAWRRSVTSRIARKARSSFRASRR